MLYAGTYNECLFQIISTTSKLRVVLLNRMVEDSVISIADIQSANINDCSKHIIGVVSLKPSGNIDGYAGQLSVMKKFVESLIHTGLYKAVQDFKYFVGEETYGVNYITTMSCNMDVYTAGKIRNITLEKISSQKKFQQQIDTNSDFKELQLETLATSLKTMKELREVYDLSWYENIDGTCKKDYRLITTEEELLEVLETIKNPKWEYVSVDTEYSNKNIFWRQDVFTELYGMSISWQKDQGVYIVFNSKKTEYLDANKWVKEIVNVLNESPNKTVVHNAFAEVKICWNYNALLHVDYDTFLVEFNINIDFRDGGRDLKTLSRYYFNCETIELDQIINGRVIPELIPYFEPDVIKLYACSDSDFTRMLLMHQKQVFNIDKATCVLDYELVEMLAMAEYYGAKVNTQLLPILREFNKQDIATVEALAFKYLKDIGLRYQAGLRLPEDERTANNIELMLSDPQFKEDMKYLFSKDQKTKKVKISTDEGIQEVLQPVSDKLVPLTLKSPDDKKILYEILGYPVTRTSKQTKNVSAGKDAIEDLLVHKSKERVPFLKKDIKSAISGSEYAKYIPPRELTIIRKDELETLKYPFALILQTYRKLVKREESFFKPLASDSADGWYYTNTSMVAARTSRVINKIQTIDGDLKSLITTFSDKYYYIVFDMSQIEFRVMMGISNALWNRVIERLIATGDKSNIEKAKQLKEKSLDDVINRLNHPYRDYHREGGSKIVGSTPSKMTSEERKKVKPIHFAVPYGADASSIAKPKLRKETTDEGKQRVLDETEAILNRWRNELLPLHYFLEKARDNTLVPVPDSELPERLKGQKIGRVQNEIGRTRYFHLATPVPRNIYEDVDELIRTRGLNREQATRIVMSRAEEMHKASIRRESGNFPIQSLARDIFFSGMIKLYREVKRRGFFGTDKDFFKILLSIFVHDECGMQVHKSVHPYCVFDMIERNCKTQLHGHPTYFMNVAVAESWSEGKSDEYESSLPYLHSRGQMYVNNPEFYDDQAFRIISQKDFIYEDIRDHFYHEVIDTFAKEVAAGTQLHRAVEDTEEYYITGHLDMWAPYIKEKSLVDRVIGCFICYPEYLKEKWNLSLKDIVLEDGSTLEEVFRNSEEWIANNKPNPNKWISTEDVITRHLVNDITSFEEDFNKVEEMTLAGGLDLSNDMLSFEDTSLFTEALDSAAKDISEKIISSGSMVMDIEEYLGDLADYDDIDVPTEDIALDESVFDSIDVSNLETLLQKGEVDDEELYRFSDGFESIVSDRLEDENIMKEYNDIFETDYDAYNAMVLRSYLVNDISDEEINEIKELENVRQRVIIFRDSLTLDLSGLSNVQQLKVIGLLKEYITDSTDSLNLYKMYAGKIEEVLYSNGTRKEIVKISRNVPHDKLNLKIHKMLQEEELGIDEQGTTTRNISALVSLFGNDLVINLTDAQPEIVRSAMKFMVQYLDESGFALYKYKDKKQIPWMYTNKDGVQTQVRLSKNIPLSKLNLIMNGFE